MTERPFYDRDEFLFERLGRRRTIRRSGRCCETGEPLSDCEREKPIARDLTVRPTASVSRETILEL